MHSWLAKPLDWCAIQLARRGVAHLHQTKAAPDSPLRLHRPDLAADASEVELSFSKAGTFHFPSPVQTPAARNNTVFGQWFAVSERWTEYPTAILLHGWNAELCYRHMFPHLAVLLRRAGINTAMIELPYHMHRRPRDGPVTDFISSDLEGMLEATRQALLDILALARWLEGRSEAGVGLWGFSLGAWLAGLMAQSHSRFRFAVLTTPIARIDRAIAELPFCEPVRRSLGKHSADLRDLNLAARPPVLAPRDVLLVESRHDLFAPPETVEQLWKAWGQPEIWRLAHGHISVLMSMGVMKRTIGWVRERVHEKSRPHPGAAA